LFISPPANYHRGFGRLIPPVPARPRLNRRRPADPEPRRVKKGHKKIVSTVATVSPPMIAIAMDPRTHFA
jgi:hypothetical protein